MKLGEKIRTIRKEKKMKIKDLHKRLVEIFGDAAIEEATISRIERGRREGKISSLHQICIGLEVTLGELMEGVEEEPKVIEISRKTERKSGYLYSGKAYSEILVRRPLERKTLLMHLNLAPGGETTLEQEPPNSEKMIVLDRGEKVEVVVGENKEILRKDDAACFDANIPHKIINRGKTKARCTVVLTPPSL